MAEKVTIGNCELWHGDCREVLPQVTALAVVSDPPYGIGFAHGGNDRSGIGKGAYATKFAKETIAGDDQPFDPGMLTALGLPMILWGGNHFASRLSDSPSWLVWDKRAASGHSNDFADCEIAWTNIGGVARVFRHHWDGMMKASERGVPRTHPTQKPVALMEWCIRQAGLPAVVLDPYMGSGATGVAAVNLGLRFIGVEIHGPYFEEACRRIEQAYAQPRLFEDAKVGAGDTAVQGDMLLPANSD